MALFLLLVVFPAFTTQIEVNKLSGAGPEETNHPDGFADKARGFASRWKDRHGSKNTNLPPYPSPPPSLSSSKSTKKLGH
ncbi:hypothetical protein AALP_AA1G116100 [Arabis alpina]|uniref:Uncharacterized protein n=1 Tax=Arabis alpina TaxID=50452 RepID=A0A087HMK9_ARAAL|nr:hypothetical protein AALP_AA1G116100 [Arabis alpina]